MDAISRYTETTGGTCMLEGVLEGGFDASKNLSGHIGNSLSKRALPPIVLLSCKQVTVPRHSLQPPFGYTSNENRRHTHMRGAQWRRCWRMARMRTQIGPPKLTWRSRWRPCSSCSTWRTGQRYTTRSCIASPVSWNYYCAEASTSIERRRARRQLPCNKG